MLLSKRSAREGTLGPLSSGPRVTFGSVRRGPVGPPLPIPVVVRPVTERRVPTTEVECEERPILQSSETPEGGGPRHETHGRRLGPVQVFEIPVAGTVVRP